MVPNFQKSIRQCTAEIPRFVQCQRAIAEDNVSMTSMRSGYIPSIQVDRAVAWVGGPGRSPHYATVLQVEVSAILKSFKECIMYLIIVVHLRLCWRQEGDRSAHLCILVHPARVSRTSECRRLVVDVRYNDSHFCSCSRRRVNLRCFFPSLEVS